MTQSPKVFGLGDVTICLNAKGFRLYVGCIEVQYLTKVQFVDEALWVTFKQGQNSEEKLVIEENLRLVRSIPWIHVSQ